MNSVAITPEDVELIVQPSAVDDKSFRVVTMYGDTCYRNSVTLSEPSTMATYIRGFAAEVGANALDLFWMDRVIYAEAEAELLKMEADVVSDEEMEHYQADSQSGNGKPNSKPKKSNSAAIQKAIAALPDNLVTNRVDVTVDDDDNAEGSTKKITVPLSMSEILGRTRTQTDDWPRRVDDVLFVHDTEHGICHLEKTPALFGWLHSVGRVAWHNYGDSVVKQSEMMAELRRTTTAYLNVEAFPHEPPMQKHYYACETPEPGDGSRLRQLVDRFSPATLVDHDLILSAFVTPGWGGPAGTRPCYVITSPFGRGVGKTTQAEMVGLLYGGVLSFSHREDIQKVKTRLLTPNAMTKRVALLDNVKSLKFSWGELEHLITATSIDGHRMYHGNGTRPNLLTWFVTLNGAVCQPTWLSDPSLSSWTSRSDPLVGWTIPVNLSSGIGPN